jgi:hypothetical protein
MARSGRRNGTIVTTAWIGTLRLSTSLYLLLTFITAAAEEEW